jgi:response regulator RpfG family c-di-GMP phosphodiesterase
VPPGVLEKAYAGEHLTEDENSLFMSHPEVGGRLISNIPRLEAIARMVEDQQRPFNSYSTLPSVMEERDVIVGAQMLKVVIDLDQLITGGMSPSVALAELRGHPDQYNPEMVKALSEAKGMTASLLA